MAYQGTSVAAVLASVALSLSVLRDHIARLAAPDGAALSDERLKEAVRATDWLLVHETPRAQLVARCNELSASYSSNSATTGP
jgi:hypothetical protein